MVQENLTVEGNKIDKVMEYVMNTPENTNPAVLRGMLESLSSEGGDGDSDLSTTQVTLVNYGNTGLFIPVCIETPFTGSLPVPSYNATTITAILYKGHCYIEDVSDLFDNTSGNIQFNEELEMYDITGDCTITFKDAHH